MNFSKPFKICIPSIIVIVVVFLIYPIINTEPPINRTSTDLCSMRIAIMAYYDEFRFYPTGNNAQVISQLIGNNPKEIAFLEIPSDTLDDNLNFVDVWGTPYLIQIKKDVIQCRSAGENGIFEENYGDDISVPEHPHKH